MPAEITRVVTIYSLCHFAAHASSVQNAIVIQSSGAVDESIQRVSIRRHTSAHDAGTWREHADAKQDALDNGSAHAKQAFLNRAEFAALRSEDKDDFCKFELTGTTSSAGTYPMSDFMEWLLPQSDMFIEGGDSNNETLPYETPEILMDNIPPAPLSLRKSRPEPLVDRSASTFTSRYECKDEPTLTRAFAALDNRTGGHVTRGAVERSFANPWVGLKFTIAQQQAKMTVHPNHHGIVGHWRYYETQWWGTQLEALLNDLLREVELPDMEFAVSMLDGSPDTNDLDGTREVGVFKAEGAVGDDLLMIPRSLIFDWGDQARKLAVAYKQKPCEQQKKTAVWRGATTGGGNTWRNATGAKNFKLYGYGGGTLPRWQLVDFSRKHPELLDAAFTRVVQIDRPQDFISYLTKHGMMKEKLDDDAQRCYAAVVVVDGNTGADRLPRQLAYGIPAVLLHNETLSHGNEFWYGELRPGIDYVSATQETLQSTLTKLLGDASLQKCIGENGRRFVEASLSEGLLKCYMHKLLQEYGKRYRAGYR
jgi:hypothetical protein